MLVITPSSSPILRMPDTGNYPLNKGIILQWRCNLPDTIDTGLTTYRTRFCLFKPCNVQICTIISLSGHKTYQTDNLVYKSILVRCAFSAHFSACEFPIWCPNILMVPQNFDPVLIRKEHKFK